MRSWEAGAPVDLRANSGINATGSAVNSWTSAGSATAVATASGTERPTLVAGGINGRDALEFDGVNDLMDMTATAAEVFQNRSYGRTFTVLTAVLTSGFVNIAHSWTVNGSTNNRAALWTKNTTTFGLAAAGRRLDSDTGNVSPLNGDATNPTLAEAVFDWVSNNAFLVRDGVSGSGSGFSSGGGSTSNTASTGVRIGSNESPATNNQYRGRIAAVAAFNVNLGAALFARIRHNYARAYNIASA